MRKAFAICLFVLLLSVASFAKPCNKAKETKHTVKATARPFIFLGHETKVVARPVGKAVAGTAIFTAELFDAVVLDPAGVFFQLSADALDMGVAAPLEAMPEPLETLGDGVHIVYGVIDAFGQKLAK